MDPLQALLNLPEPERQRLAEALLLLRNLGSSNVSSEKSGTDLKDSLKSASNAPEKPVSKQKTLDGWILKNKNPPSNCEKVLTKSNAVVPTRETNDVPRNSDSKEVSSTLQDPQLPCSSSAPIEKSSKSENINSKKLMVLLNRQDCDESKHNSPDHSELFENVEKISPSENTCSSENSDKKTISPEKHSPTPLRSYNLRSARGVSEEKLNSEVSNNVVISAESEIRDKNHKTNSRVKSKSIDFVGNDASPNSSTCLKEVKHDQKNDSCNEMLCKQNNKSSESKTRSTVINAELEKTPEVMPVDCNKITLETENKTPVESGTALTVTGKRNKGRKSTKSKKLCVANSTQDSSPGEVKPNSESAQSIPSMKVTSLNVINGNPSQSSIEKSVQSPVTDKSNSPNKKQLITNDSNKSVSKLKLRKTTKRKDKNNSLMEETESDSNTTIAKKKKLLIPEIDSNVTQNEMSPNEISDNLPKSATTLESQIKENAQETEELFTKDVNSVNIDSKRISRKRGSKNKSIKSAKNSLLSDTEMVSKISNEDSINEDSVITSSNNFTSLNTESAKMIEELPVKDADTKISENADSKKISKERGSETKSSKAAKKRLLCDSEQTSKISDKVRKTSIETSTKMSPSQNNQVVKETKNALIKDVNTVSSKKKIRKAGSEHKIVVGARNTLSADSEQASKNDDRDNNTPAETLSIDSLKKIHSPSQSKENFKETEELSIEDTNAATSIKLISKKPVNKRGIRNKTMVVMKKNVLSASEQASKDSSKDCITSDDTLSKLSISKDLSNKDNTVTSIDLISKKSVRKKGSRNKTIMATEKDLLSDSEKVTKNSNKDSKTSIESPSKISHHQIKDFSKATEELLMKDTDSGTSINSISKRTTRKKGTGKKSMEAVKKSLLSDSEQVSKNSDADRVTSIETLSKISSSQNNELAKETEELLMKDKCTISPQTVCSKKKIGKAGNENKNMVVSKNSFSSDTRETSENNDQKCIISAETRPINSSKNSPLLNEECSRQTEELLINDTNAVPLGKVSPKRTRRKRGCVNKSVITTNSVLSDSELSSKNNDKDRITSINTPSTTTPSQSGNFADEGLLVKAKNTVSSKTLCPKKKFRKTDSENKNVIATKNNLSSDSEPSSKTDHEVNFTNAEILSVDSSKKSLSKSKESCKETEPLLKDTNTAPLVNVESKRKSRKKVIENKSMVTTDNSLISESIQITENCDKDSATSVKILSIDSFKDSASSCEMDLYVGQTSSLNNAFTTEKINISLNESVILHSQSDDLTRKTSLNSSGDKLNSLSELEESTKDKCQKSREVSPDLPHPQENSNLPCVFNKENDLKEIVPKPANLKKKIKLTKDKGQSNTDQCILDNLDCEIENPALKAKKNVSKRKVVTDSSKEHTDAVFPESKASSLNSDVVQEQQKQLSKNLNNKFTQGLIEKTNLKANKIPFKKNSECLESKVVSNVDLPKNNEAERSNFNLVGKMSMKNKLCKTKKNKKAPIKFNKNSSSKKSIEIENLSHETSGFEMELDSTNCNNNNSCDNSVDAKKIDKMTVDKSVDISNGLESKKKKTDVVREVEETTEKAASLTVNNSIDVVQTGFKNLVEFDKNNGYSAFCIVKDMLEAIGISIEDFFEHPEIVNFLNSVSPDSVIKIKKCKSDSKIVFSCLSQKKK